MLKDRRVLASSLHALVRSSTSTIINTFALIAAKKKGLLMIFLRCDQRHAGMEKEPDKEK